ncbi:MAG TPA: dTDP-4-dehydrorhamnose 3,5-epimerase [Galbitalea sp.]
MEIRELSVPHAWEVSPLVRRDDRGFFLESYRADLLAEATGRTFELKQANVSRSKYGVARGIHYADVPSGQAKYFMVTAGAVVDFVVDIRLGSPTFGQWDAVELDADNRKAVFLSEGVGHLFVVTSESADVNYLINEYYNPAREHAISARDPAIGLRLPIPAADIVLSEQDAAAPGLEDAAAAGILPNWADCLELYATRSAGEGASR